MSTTLAQRNSHRKLEVTLCLVGYASGTFSFSMAVGCGSTGTIIGWVVGFFFFRLRSQITMYCACMHATSAVGRESLRASPQAQQGPEAGAEFAVTAVWSGRDRSYQRLVN